MVPHVPQHDPTKFPIWAWTTRIGFHSIFIRCKWSDVSKSQLIEHVSLGGITFFPWCNEERVSYILYCWSWSWRNLTNRGPKQLYIYPTFRMWKGGQNSLKNTHRSSPPPYVGELYSYSINLKTLRHLYIVRGCLSLYFFSKYNYHWL